MNLVVDTNPIISALIKDSTTRKIILYPKLDFFTPEYVFVEINNHKDVIMKKSGYDETELQMIIDTVFSNIAVLPISEYQEFIPKAYGIMKEVDEFDTAFLALALMIKGDGIWTNDPDFEKQKEVKVWKTEDMVRILEF